MYTDGAGRARAWLGYASPKFLAFVLEAEYAMRWYGMGWRLLRSHSLPACHPFGNMLTTSSVRPRGKRRGREGGKGGAFPRAAEQVERWGLLVS